MEIDWKKKYEEALEKARELYGTVAVGKNFFVEIFPELAESEDAMMEKAIVDALLSHCNSINLLSERGYQIEDVKAWLEKQKEQKPNYCHYGGDPNIERCRCCSASCSGRLADEQKPPIAGNDFGWIDELKHDLEHPEELDQKVDDALKQRKGMSLEWSEEDEKWFEEIELMVLYFTDDEKYREKFISWLKSLKNRGNFPKSNTNSPSWSEEDEEMIGDIISSLRGYMCLASKSPYYTNHETHIQKEIEFLNALRPHWKPSDEHKQ